MNHIWNNIEFTYNDVTRSEIDSFNFMDIYSDVTIVKGNTRYPEGFKVDQISILSSIKFENTDGSENKGVLTPKELEDIERLDLIFNCLQGGSELKYKKEYKLAAENFRKAANLTNDPLHYTQAAICYEEVNYIEAINNYLLAIKIYVERNNIDNVGRFYAKIAELYQQNGDVENSLKY